MENILKNRLGLFYLIVATVLVGIVIFIIIILFLPLSPSESPADTAPTALASPTIRLSPPALQSKITPTKQGMFTVTFPMAPNPNALTITLNSSLTSAPFKTLTVPFSSEFQKKGTLLVITTTNPLQANTIYTLYVRLVSNNHIVVKHRYENINGKLTIIDTD